MFCPKSDLTIGEYREFFGALVSVPETCLNYIHWLESFWKKHFTEVDLGVCFGGLVSESLFEDKLGNVVHESDLYLKLDMELGNLAFAALVHIMRSSSVLLYLKGTALLSLIFKDPVRGCKLKNNFL